MQYWSDMCLLDVGITRHEQYNIIVIYVPKVKLVNISISDNLAIQPAGNQLAASWVEFPRVMLIDKDKGNLSAFIN